MPVGGRMVDGVVKRVDSDQGGDDMESLIAALPYEKGPHLEKRHSEKSKRRKITTEFGKTKKDRMASIGEYIHEISGYTLGISNRAVDYVERWGCDDIQKLVDWFKNEWLPFEVDDTGVNPHRGGRSPDKIMNIDIEEYMEIEKIGVALQREWQRNKDYMKTPEAWLHGVLNDIKTKASGVEEIRMRNAARREYNRIKGI